MSRPRILALAAAGVVAALALPGAALADHYADVSAPPTNPTSASQIQNIGQVTTAIKNYYGDHTTSTTDPVPDEGAPESDHVTKSLHQYGENSAYAHEVAGITAAARTYLANEAKPGKQHSGQPAILFDIDDTTLNTYSYEIYSAFSYNPAQNADFVNAGSKNVFPAVPTMPALEQAARDLGYQVFFLTGRPATQLDGTKANLSDAGYTFDNDKIYLKDQTKPWLASCAPSCSTIQYKSLTRKYIESQGYDIVANFGDQYSDLEGGYADQTYKIPNPMYYLP